jgi:electron transfer flavoprotein beta subunit
MFDLLLFGIMAEDDQGCQTGQMVAAILNMPCSTTVVKETINDDRESVIVERELEGGRREVVELKLPAVLTIQSGINVPRYPSLSNKLRAKKQELEIISADEFNAARKCEEPVRVYLPPPAGGAVFIEGSIAEQAERLVKILHEKANVL